MGYRIGCDLDGILADFAQYWTGLLRSMFPDTELPHHTHADLPSYDLQGQYPDLRGRIKEARHIFYQTPNVWEYMPSLLTPKQWERLAYVMHTWEFHFTTARNAKCAGDSVTDQTRRWLQKYLPWHAGVIRVHHAPYDVKGPQKPDVCREWGIPIMIDEHPDAVEALWYAGLTVWMQVYPYNVQMFLHPRIWRAPNFDAILDALEVLA